MLTEEQIDRIAESHEGEAVVGLDTTRTKAFGVVGKVMRAGMVMDIGKYGEPIVEAYRPGGSIWLFTDDVKMYR